MPDQLIKYDYTGSPTLQRFAMCDDFFRGIMGPFASGKSSACISELGRRGQGQARGTDGIRHSRFAVVRNTYSELRDTTINSVMQWFPQHHFGTWKSSEHLYTIKGIPGCEIELMFRALDKADDVGKLLSLELTGAWVNEAREIPWAIMETLQGRVDRYPSKKDGGCTWSGVWADTNPPDDDSAWYKYFEEVAPTLERGTARLFKQPSGLSDRAENLVHLNAGRRYYERLAQGKGAEWIKVYVEGRYGFVMEGKLVFEEYNDTAHCRSVDPQPGLPVYRGWDFGLTPCCVFCQVLPDGRFLVFDELTSEGMGIDEFSDLVLEHCAKRFKGRATFIDIGDPAGLSPMQTDKRTCFEILHGKGVAIEGGVQEIKLRLESVRLPMRRMSKGEPLFVLHPRCKVLRKGFLGGYHYKRQRIAGLGAEVRYQEKPDKNWASHPMDALQYVCGEVFGIALRMPASHAADQQPPAYDPDYGYSGVAMGDGRSAFTGY